ncbi:NmrA family NAD(P)-binding protein [Nocardiopsis ansamitocini]|uniref:NAD(P)-dependent oxidoreductase n=1 Tax=Nocardiopsis ansamitocini TaxID=1670832 RepID=A0A9W6P3G5_9ACTN|nr:NmrA family NAD(P)-binding protein [Nocardiopsis ansamitocini]GLU46466.1 NAD(P)-dependent oxidoreductase [Nocardiopsis ansamitocini]
MTQPRVLVTGAAGKTGRAVLAALAHKGARARALVHREDQSAGARTWGAAETVVGDMRDRAVLKQAASGVDAIYHIAPNMSPDEVEIGETLISAAKAAGVWRVVYHSVLRPQIQAMPHHWAKLLVEEALFRSGLNVTVLQPGPYAQNLLAELDTVRATGQLRVPYSIEVEFAMVDLWDVAAVAARCLTEPVRAPEADLFRDDARVGLAALDDHGADDDHSFAVYELAGPRNVSVRQVSGAFGTVLGSPVTAVTVPLDEWRSRAEEAGMAEPVRAGLAAMFDYYDAHGLRGNGRTLRTLLRRPGLDAYECLRREARMALSREERDAFVRTRAARRR